MSTTATQTQTQANSHPGQGGRGGHRHRRGGRGGKSGGQPKETAPQTSAEKSKQAQLHVEDPSKDTDPQTNADGDVEQCFICAEPVKYYAVSQCNHRTCHVCALRLRALYKKMECTFCKEPQTSIIFTVSPDALFSSYTPDSIPHQDTRLAISFETEEMMEDTLILLRFNCPDRSCDYTATGWGDLKLHVRGVHGKVMCDLCIRSKKIFAHEHALYTPSQLPLHLPSIPHRSYRNQNEKPIEGGVHPLCEFCCDCFFSDDELYAHMREKHEECFVCKRNEIRDQYFRDYDSLERHFNNAHHPCTDPSCLARKFVVFNTVLDLKAHMVEEHGTNMTARDRKDARRVEADFEFEQVGIGNRRGRRDRERPDREHNNAAAPAAGPSRPGGRRREGFGAHLTADGSANVSPNHLTPEPSRRPSPSPPPDMDPVLAERHAAFTARLRALTPNSTTAVAAVKTAIRGYRTSEISARDLISTIWNILDRNLDESASLVNALVDLLDDEDKKKDLLTSWNGFKVEQRRQFPDLVPSSVGSGYAGIASGRVLNAKNSAASRSSSQSSRQVWDRVAQAAASSSAPSYPALQPPERVQPAHSAGPPAVPFRQQPRNTPWASASSKVRSGPGPVHPRSETRAGGPPRPAPALSKALFPELPSLAAARQKTQVKGNQSLKNILGESGPASSVWGGKSNGAELPEVTAGAVEDSGAAGADGNAAGGGPAKGKKGKGKQKQTLFTLGSFPT